LKARGFEGIAVAMTRGREPGAKKAAKGSEHSGRARLEVDERRAQLLALGLTIFSDRAYDDVAIEDIARAAGVSKGLLYHYFPTKRDFYVAALREAAKALIEQTIGADTGGKEGERLRRGLTTYCDFVEKRGGAYVALMRGGIGSDPEVASILEDTRVAILEHIIALLPEGMDGPLATTALRGWIGFVEAASIDWVARRSVSLAEIVELAHAALFDVLMRAAAIAHRVSEETMNADDRE
jgi:AcrR family transcriptional regulator